MKLAPMPRAHNCLQSFLFFRVNTSTFVLSESQGYIHVLKFAPTPTTPNEYESSPARAPRRVPSGSPHGLFIASLVIVRVGARTQFPFAPNPLLGIFVRYR